MGLSIARRVLRLATALLILAAIVVQLFNPDDPWAVAANFFSFFTIQSNLFAAVVLIVVAARAAAPRSPRLDVIRGAATLYLLITGVVFALLLSNIPEDLQLTLPWVDTVLHQVAPILIVLDWLVDPPRSRIAPAHRAAVARLPARLGGLHADPRRDRRLVPVPVHQRERPWISHCPARLSRAVRWHSRLPHWRSQGSGNGLAARRRASR